MKEEKMEQSAQESIQTGTQADGAIPEETLSEVCGGGALSRGHQLIDPTIELL